jgi:hypothetical protein
MVAPLRQLAALLLLLSPVQGTAAAFAAAEAGSGHCAKRVCECRHQCAPQKKKTTPRGCHEAPAPSSLFSMSSRCGHRGETPAPASIEPHVAASSFRIVPIPASAPYILRSSASLPATFLAIDTPPPKTRA